MLSQFLKNASTPFPLATASLLLQNVFSNEVADEARNLRDDEPLGQ
jgi:hypothetical protein